jgi:glycosyltransferase involved in cell wall biosynthesis
MDNEFTCDGGDVSKRPLVSIVLIFLNEECFLDEAVQSVLAQTFDDWELLLVDDGSSDGSSAIAQRYAGQMPERVRCLEHPGHANRGMSASRNLGIRHARGDYIAPFDGDDVWLPEKLEEQVGVLESHPEVALTYGLPRLWYSWTGRPEDAHRDCLFGTNRRGRAPNANRIVQPPEQLIIFLRDLWYIPCSVVVRRSVLRQVGGYEDSFADLFEDAIVWAKVCLHHPVYVSDKCSYLYRRHSRNSTLILHREGKGPEARERYLTRAEQYFLTHEVTDRRVWRALRWAQFLNRNPHLLGLLELARGRFIRERLRGYRRGLARRLLPEAVRSWFGADESQANDS